MSTKSSTPDHSLLRTVFSPSLYFFLALAVGCGLLAYAVGGPEALSAAATADVELLRQLVPRMIAAVLIAGFIRALVPPEVIGRLAGRRSGIAGLLAATVAGIVTLGGPTAAFSLAAAMRVGGADRGTLVAYVTSWSMLGMQRIMVWEVPLLGGDFALTRFVASAAMPVIAGLIARRLPIDIHAGTKP